jgi:diaminopimelate epimerase
MKLAFTKMQGAGNDFVVIDATRGSVELHPDQVRQLGDRRFGVGADQILVVEAASSPGVDFRYRIFNNSGEEVEHCGNGARCFLRYVRAKGLTDRRRVRVQTMNRVLELLEGDDGRVRVDMGPPEFDLARVPFDPTGLEPLGSHDGEPATLSPKPAAPVSAWARWPLTLDDGRTQALAVLSMGNPHAVQRVAAVDTAPVATDGPRIEAHWRFPQRVNAGFLQVLDRRHIRLRVYERGAGETLACGTGACAAVVAGVRLGWLDGAVDVDTRGGRLTIEWAGLQDLRAPVFMTGPAEFVFEGEIEL